MDRKDRTGHLVVKLQREHATPLSLLLSLRSMVVAVVGGRTNLW